MYLFHFFICFVSVFSFHFFFLVSVHQQQICTSVSFILILPFTLLRSLGSHIVFSTKLTAASRWWWLPNFLFVPKFSWHSSFRFYYGSFLSSSSLAVGRERVLLSHFFQFVLLAYTWLVILILCKIKLYT
jgi:hypothetical protein